MNMKISLLFFGKRYLIKVSLLNEISVANLNPTMNKHISLVR